MINLNESALNIQSEITSPSDWWLTFSLDEFTEVPFIREQVIAMLMGWA